MNTRSFFLASLVAGVAIGVLGNLPLLNLINCVLCFWVWIGGVLAVLLYRRYQPRELGPTAAQGAGLGALAGLIGALVGAVVFAVTSSLSVPLFNSLARILQIEGNFFNQGGFGDTVRTTLIFLVIDIILYPIFGALGGLITASVSKPRSPVTPGV